jgi:hypothetical protein
MRYARTTPKKKKKIHSKLKIHTRKFFRLAGTVRSGRKGIRIADCEAKDQRGVNTVPWKLLLVGDRICTPN